MSKYTVEINYKASIVHTVEAEDEGQALDKARELAENADISEFILSESGELQSFILSAE